MFFRVLTICYPLAAIKSNFGCYAPVMQDGTFPKSFDFAVNCCVKDLKMLKRACKT